MANLKGIRDQIASVKSTQQITRAMKMVAAAKLRRAQANIVNLRPYANRLRSVISDVALTQRIKHPLLSPSQNPQRILVVVLTSDRGLCGGFNNNINRFAHNHYIENKDKYEKYDFFFIGRKAMDYFKFQQINSIDNIVSLAKEISYALAARVADQLMDAYSQGNYDEIYFIYNEFKSAISQEVILERLLPIDLSHSTLDNEESGHKFSRDLIFEPTPEQIIDELLHKHFAVQVYRCMSESVAAEHGARMAAMESATKNAGEKIDDLTLTYNKLRQAAITKELIEITSGAEALKG